MIGDRLDLDKLELVFSDDFDGSVLDLTKWSCRTNAEGTYAGGYWSLENLILKDSNLIIRTDKRSDGTYLSSAVSTIGKFDQLYGYFEARAILPDAQGLSASFWMLPTVGFGGNTQGGRAGVELDIMESSVYHSDPLRHDFISQNIHVDGYGRELKSLRVADVPAIDPYRSYNTYGLLWNEREYIFYVNRIETARSSFHSGTSTVPQYLIMQVAVNGEQGIPKPGWTGDISKNSDDKFPADYIIDHVLVYRLKT